MEKIKPTNQEDRADEDIMIFWSREKLEHYFMQNNKYERIQRRQKNDNRVTRQRRRCASINLFKRNIN